MDSELSEDGPFKLEMLKCRLIVNAVDVAPTRIVVIVDEHLTGNGRSVGRDECI